ncbi:acetolactate decarboxylase [Eubacteriaceae bacterium ES2]|nr:acetolactate decarboxylase [Eubacteriaceae bacterium ES2]
MNQNVLYQYSTLKAFNNKGYDGDLTLETLKAYGDTGLGTFNALDGEMILLDKKIYQADGDCVLKKTDDGALIPFAVMGFLDAEKVLSLKGRLSMEAAKIALDQEIGLEDPIVLAVLEGFFGELTLHSVWPQTKPYRGLEVIVSEQKLVRTSNQRGRLVGIRCPQSAIGKNVVGWHFHYLSADQKTAGHVNDFKSEDVSVSYSIKERIVEIFD